ncbi:MAG: hypothetical protein J6P98_02085, partial [Clostridia bacterium]|nr:hypothetical protein [Clostridia bacterium]
MSRNTDRIKRSAARTTVSKLRTMRSIKAIKKKLFIIKTLCMCVFIAMLFTGCAEFLQWDDEVPHVTSAPTAEPEGFIPTEAPAVTERATEEPVSPEAPTPEPTAEPTEAATEEPTAEPTEAPGYVSASLGFAGDVLLMQAQINSAKTASGYDFKDMFRPMQGLFES